MQQDVTLKTQDKTCGTGTGDREGPGAVASFPAGGGSPKPGGVWMGGNAYTQKANSVVLRSPRNSEPAVNQPIYSASAAERARFPAKHDSGKSSKR